LQLHRDLDLVLGFGDLRPRAGQSQGSIDGAERLVELLPEAVEDPVDVAVQGNDRVVVFPPGKLRLLMAPGERP
jgi:hypothetical protein